MTVNDHVEVFCDDGTTVKGIVQEVGAQLFKILEDGTEAVIEISYYSTQRINHI